MEVIQSFATMRLGISLRAQLLSTVTKNITICHDVLTEPPLQPISGEV